MAPNLALELTRNGCALLALISFWALRAQPLLAAQLSSNARCRMNMRIPRLLAFAAITLLSDANASEHRCWLNRITAEEGGIRIAIDATPELRFRFNGKSFSFQVSNAELGASSAGGLDKSNGILLKSGDRLEIYTSSSNIQRCVIEPVIGPEFSGVSLESWGASKGEPTPFVLARTVRADRE